MLAQDHDGLLELDEVDASKAVASSSRAAMDPAVGLRLLVPDRTGPGIKGHPPRRVCAFQYVAVRSVADAFEYGDTLSGPFGMR